MKKLILKMFIFVLPFAVVLLASTFLPLNFFTFRFEEALKVYGNPAFPGPFYPLQKSRMMEEGDMGHGTPYAIKKDVYWETDRLGYRNSGSSANAEIVLVGDSNVYGNGITQNKILSEVLEAKLQTNVFPYAPAVLNTFIRDQQFRSARPKFVVLECIERNIYNRSPELATETIRRKQTMSDSLSSILCNNKSVIAPLIVVDRLLKMELLHYTRSLFTNSSLGVYHEGMFFYQGANAVANVKDRETINRISATISNYNKYFMSKNVHFIYMPIPNKETIYSDRLPGKPQVSVLKQLLHELEQKGVPTINLVDAFEVYRVKGGMPYQVDDTHWSEDGVKIAADLLTAKITELNSRN